MHKTTIISSTLLCLGLASSPNLLAEIGLNPPVAAPHAVQPAVPAPATPTVPAVPDARTPNPIETGVTPPPPGSGTS